MSPPATAAARPLVTVQSVEGDMAIDGAARRMALLAEQHRVKAKAEKLEKKRKRPKEEHEAEDIQHGPLPVEQLQASGIVAGDVQKLKDVGFYTIEAVVYSPRKELLQIEGIGKAKVYKIIEAGMSL
ncbi:hypothetical protein EJ110_NYTH00434 [Nymphaea thermarum]|nr:hypothetical protein EJ110_NYTH00434 [Nymphaea thermarum]